MKIELNREDIAEAVRAYLGDKIGALLTGHTLSNVEVKNYPNLHLIAEFERPEPEIVAAPKPEDA